MVTRTISFLRNYGDFLQLNGPSDNLGSFLFGVREARKYCHRMVLSTLGAYAVEIYLNALSL